MNTNGHVAGILPEDVERIMDEWEEITYDTRKQLHGDDILKDSRDHAEGELDIILTKLIQFMFPLEGGAEPNELTEEGMQAHLLWDSPRFARKLEERARGKKTSVRGFIKWAFSPKFSRNGKIIEEEPIDSLRRALFRSDGRNMILNRLLGEGEASRIDAELKAIVGENSKPKFEYGIQSVSKRRRPDRSDDPEELKAIPQLTTARGE